MRRATVLWASIRYSVWVHPTMGPRREIPVGLRCLVSARGRSGSRRFHLVRKRTSPQPEVDHQDDPAILGRLAGVPRELEGHHESVLPQHRHPAHAAAGSAAVRERSIHHGECRSPAHRIDRSNFVGGVTARPERDVPVGRVPDQFRPASRSKLRAPFLSRLRYYDCNPRIQDHPKRSKQHGENRKEAKEERCHDPATAAATTKG
mmetsp:Transcript_5166/g.15120  ORF Transcript_5166/g.15120 Transcript_5166/m.15120 type:complete len:205 (+) Transcript_5166:70-684(+)